MGLRAKARAAARRGDWVTAVAQYRVLTSRASPRAGDLVQVAHALKEIGDEAGALRAYRRAADRHPQDLDAQRQLPLFLRRLGRNTEAADYLARASILFPEAADLTHELHDIAGAEAAVLDSFYLRGILRGRDIISGRGDGEGYRRVIARWLTRRADILARNRDWAGAERWHRRALMVLPNRIGSLVQLGHALREQGQPVEALFLYRRALVLSPRRYDPYVHIGHALKALDRRESAFNAYLMAWRLNPGLASLADELAALRNDISESTLEEDIHGRGIDVQSAKPIEPVQVGRPRLIEEKWLTLDQLAIFKHLAGSLDLKD